MAEKGDHIDDSQSDRCPTEAAFGRSSRKIACYINENSPYVELYNFGGRSKPPGYFRKVYTGLLTAIRRVQGLEVSVKKSTMVSWHTLFKLSQL